MAACQLHAWVAVLSCVQWCVCHVALQEAMDAAGLDIVDFVDVGIEVGTTPRSPQ